MTIVVDGQVYKLTDLSLTHAHSTVDNVIQLIYSYHFNM